MRCRLLTLSAGLALTLLGCVHAPPTPTAPPQKPIVMEPVQVTPGDPTDQLLASMNDEELFAKGTSAYAAQDYKLASRAFDRLCTLFPQSSHFAAATYNAGLAHEQLSQWQEAFDRYQPLLDVEHGTGDQLDAAFRAAECLYHLEKYADAIALLERIQKRPDLSKNLQLEAEVQIGICQTEAGQLQQGETTLRDAVHRYDSADEAERLDDYYPAQAQFFLGEIYRLYFDQIALDPNTEGGTEKLAQDLEYKAEMLLSAQGHYLRAIRIGNSNWATAAGQRIGALYESMYDAMTHAPAPKDLDAEQVQVYQEELRKKVRVLVTKAITIYERTLEAAERTGTDGPFISQARASLERMKTVLLVDGKPDEPEPMPDPPKKAPQPVRKGKLKPSSARTPSPARDPLARAP